MLEAGLVCSLVLASALFSSVSGDVAAAGSEDL